ncbi:MAG: peptidase U32 family protein, partial [Candidatus Bathyarchaeia archaeon]
MLKILSPVTSFDATVGVIEAGADEIYFGVKIPGVKYPGLSLRTYRSSLQSYDELGAVVEYAHEHSVETIVTMEFPFIANFVEDRIKAHVISCVEKGVDAIIAGDIGIILTLLDMKIGIPIYASTYLASMNYEAVDFLRKLGVKRVILERQVSLREIGEIVNHRRGEVEIEVFVHGPGCSNINVNCYGCSGSVVKPTKADYKGLVTPTCRVMYDVYRLYRGKRKRMGAVPILDAYSFCSLCHLQELVKTGIAGIKIVGRDGPPFYQVLTTKIYRELVDLLEEGNL